MQHESWQSSFVFSDTGIRERLIKRAMEDKVVPITVLIISIMFFTILFWWWNL